VRQIILDTGPLVAAINRQDEWTTCQLADIRPPLLTCEGVVSEACFLLRDHGDGIRALFEWMKNGVMSLAFRLDTETEQIGKLMKKYADVPMALADACLVRILIASTEADKSAVYQKLPGLPGEISFSRYLWDRIYEGDELKKAFIVGREAMKNHSRRNQISQMDMNGNGIGNEGEDMRLAEGVAIGRASPPAPFKLKIAKVCPEQTLKDETSATLWAPKASMIRRAFPAYRQ